MPIVFRKTCPCPTKLPEVECREIGYLAAWAFVGGDGTLFNGCNVASVTRVSAGRYRVVFTDPINPANYSVTFGNINDFPTRDGIHTEIINGTQNANGFEYYTATGDNGGAADVLRDFQANFHVAGKMTVLACIDS